ncbi:hypothetical protein D6779_03850, partial [Candidatus Parcubacteria bacterium]
IDHRKTFSVCTLVTDQLMYEQMRASFNAKGFEESQCEFIYLDNRIRNQMSASDALNLMISRSSGKYIIACHQDIRLIDTFDNLISKLEELDRIDPAWAVAGNAGGKGYRETRMHITGGDGKEVCIGTFPEKVDSLDENFLVIRRDTAVGFAHNNKGFHFYGADICLNASMRGYNCYVIDFHLVHLSGGKLDEEFWAQKLDFERRYRRFFRTRWLTTTCTPIPLTRSSILGSLLKILDPVGKRIKRFQRKTNK